MATATSFATKNVESWQEVAVVFGQRQHHPGVTHYQLLYRAQHIANHHVVFGVQCRCGVCVCVE